ncbi:hypothetical protein BKA62DRAFT_791184 [Auriculariales sp. MPI-PUGE-AT-0066]|nr:hypothetical protein BKA62DRAFT_791184 [Auriculariales sp. MPI-PUGE-AT-0066]
MALRLACRRMSTLPARPWFVIDAKPRTTPVAAADLQPPPAPLHESIPEAHPLRTLQEHMRQLPLLDPASVQIGRPIALPQGPSLPDKIARGRRRRGRSYAGEGLPLPGGGNLWDWVVLATVKEGTEGRGAVDSVLRSTRKLLKEQHPDVPLPPMGFSRRKHNEGWGMIDAGEFAVHVLSQEARQRWFGPPPADWR